MELSIHRAYKCESYTIGKLYVNGEYFCDTIEDKDRKLFQGMSEEWINQKKVYGETAIPYGRYRISMNIQSPKFANSKQYKKCKGYIPRLLEVPCFDGILMHIGNYAKDSYGCILVGENKVKGAVVNSTVWFWRLYDLLKKADENGEEIWITIQA